MIGSISTSTRPVLPSFTAPRATEATQPKQANTVDASRAAPAASENRREPLFDIASLSTKQSEARFNATAGREQTENVAEQEQRAQPFQPIDTLSRVLSIATGFGGRIVSPGIEEALTTPFLKNDGGSRDLAARAYGALAGFDAVSTPRGVGVNQLA